MSADYRRITDREADYYAHQQITAEQYEEMKKNKTSAFEIILQMNEENIDRQLREKLFRVLQKLFDLKQTRNEILLSPQVRMILQKAVRSEDENIRNLIAVQLKRAAMDDGEARSEKRSQNNNDEPPHTQLMDRELFNLLGILILDENTGVAQNALDAILNCLRNDIEVDTFMSDEFFGNLKEKSLQRDLLELKIRLLSGFVCMGKTSPKVFERIEKEEIYAEILKLVTDSKEDCIIQANALQLLEELSEFSRGINFLLQEKNLRQLTMIVKNEKEEETFRCRIIQILSTLIMHRPSEITRIIEETQDGLLDTLNRWLGSDENINKEMEVYWMLCTVSWADICSRKESCDVLHEHLPDISKCVSGNIGSTNAEISSAAMQAWTRILNNQPNEKPSEPLVVAAQEAVLPNLLHVSVKRPFSEIRVHAYELLKHICIWDWAAAAFLESVDFKNLLLDFLSESDYQCRVEKHDFVKRFMEFHSDQIREKWGTDAFDKIKAYVTSGPFSTPKGGVHLGDKAA